MFLTVGVAPRLLSHVGSDLELNLAQLSVWKGGLFEEGPLLGHAIIATFMKKFSMAYGSIK